MIYPIADMHCDLLSFLAKVPGADSFDKNQIACAFPWMQEGGVKMQVMAIYTDVNPSSSALASKQADIFVDLLRKEQETVSRFDLGFLQNQANEKSIGIIASVENAAGFGNESATWSEIYQQFDSIVSKVGQLAYISLTHHTENRFGGGNYTEGIGLKEDGKRLLDYMAGKKIPIDLSHTSDLLAEGILNHIDRHHLPIPVIASHSNFRAIWDHKRNLSDEFAQEIIHRGGIIGVNFLRAFLDPNVPERLYEHLLYGAKLGENAICFGADFFYTQDFPDKSRHPFYFPLAENSSKYPDILEDLSASLSDEQLRKLAFENVFNFYQKLWS
ncbi:microsomal dipeptidase-like Zn-dependent dipeptidase [Algoriphagus boseongensis]|uniref:Microsomal dipeptidase-like Zn-dependent dipeptidase n=1 Tax=Algoriphagus boseongensis TaxID=1442587 RepID=A0A4R6T8Q6_9BACT|nr:membrane dipeptidase [Algoriphagus boseongensis]TDQ17348.1 microsomal dipeptidase-like Zn-dependent dipeptidase [Algoriphagus boseongensis]